MFFSLRCNRFAQENKIRYFLSGMKFSLECILQQGNTWDAFDTVNIQDINRRFGSEKLDKLPLMTHRQRYYPFGKNKIIEYSPLNYIDYNRERALAELNEFCGFTYYGSKHLENDFTAFYSSTGYLKNLV